MDQFEENPVKKLQDQVAKTLPGLSHSEIATSDATDCAPALDPLASAIVDISAHFGRSHVAETLTAGLPLVNGRLPLEHGDEAAARADLLFTLESGSPLKLHATDLPVIIFTTENEPEILWAISPEENGQQATAAISLPGSPQRINVPQADVAKVAARKYIRLRPAKGHDTRSDDAVSKSETGWFLSAFKDSRRIYAEAIAATLAVNVLALAMPLFSMNVYDRVLPNAAETTLWALAIGVGIAILFDFLIRTLRATAVDAASRRADAKLSALIFGRLLGAKQSTQPASTGVRANTLREFETLRDFLNSATLTAFGDLPFLALFLVVLWVVAGPLVWIVLASIPILLGVGYLTQRALGKLIEEAFREAAQKNAVATETLTGLETIKAAGAESWAALKWEQAVSEHIRTGIAIRHTTNLGQHIIHGVQTLVQVLIVVFGFYLVSAGELTMGALIAATILSGRALQPLSQAAQLIARYNQTRIAYRSLSEIVNSPQERSDSDSYLSKTDIAGHIKLESAAFTYDPMAPPAIKDINLDIAAGQHTAIIGGTGSGKTTLLKLIQGLHQPTGGRCLIDGVSVSQLEPVLLRRQVALLLQDAALFHGTIRENIAMANPKIDDKALLDAARISSAQQWISRLPLGFDTPIRERGVGLSGGQKQSVVLARALATNPKVLLLDEPTSEMDGQTERQVITALKAWSKGRTLVVVTHRPALLELADQLVVMNHGQIVQDGPKADVLAELKQQSESRAKSSRTEQKPPRKSARVSMTRKSKQQVKKT